ncbi:MAG: hypothetical protein K0Q48_1054 [Bacillota bacterium]|jgi:hypothetical protein|nr:hypothetical protein [Bacillota bacterium]
MRYIFCHHSIQMKIDHTEEIIQYVNQDVELGELKYLMIV